MDFLPLIPYLYFGVVLLLIVTVPLFGMGAMFQFGQSFKRELFPLIFWLIAVVIIFAPLQSGRNLSGQSIIFEVDAVDFANTLWFNRLCTLAIALIAVERLLRQFVSRSRAPNRGWVLLLALVVYTLASQFLNAAFGTVNSFSHRAIYALLVVWAALFVANRDPMASIFAARNALAMVLVVSALALIVKPSLVLQSGYTGGFMPYRYWGLGPHANILSPLVVLLMGLLMVFPYRRCWLNRSVFALAWVSLLASQSKTAIVAALVMMTVVGFYQYRHKAGVHSFFTQRGLSIGLIVACMTALCAILILQVGFDVLEKLERFLASSAGYTFTTLTSRDQIWVFALREWHSNPWFGYGPSIFDQSYRVQIGLSMAYHGHNQFMHVLGAAGNVGAGALIIYFVVLGRSAWHAAAATSGLSLALFVFVALRCITEIPLTMASGTAAEFFVHLTLIILCIGYAPSQASRMGASAHGVLAAAK